jgi:hypothetical protein
MSQFRLAEWAQALCRALCPRTGIFGPFLRHKSFRMGLTELSGLKEVLVSGRMKSIALDARARAPRQSHGNEGALTYRTRSHSRPIGLVNDVATGRRL